MFRSFIVVISEQVAAGINLPRGDCPLFGRNLARLRKPKSDRQDYRAEYEDVIPIDMKKPSPSREARSLLAYRLVRRNRSAESTYERLRFKSISRVHGGRGEEGGGDGGEGRGSSKWSAACCGLKRCSFVAVG